MTAPSLPRCPVCNSAVSLADGYCAVCGSPLTRLRWRTASTDAQGQRRTGKWQQSSGRVAVQRGAQEVEVQLVNRGVTPSALVLTDDAIRQLPAWVDLDQLHEHVIQLPPGGEPRSLRIPIDSARLQHAYDHHGDDPSQPDQALVARLSLRGSPHRDLDLDLLLVRQPRLLPSGSLYRYLPIERLRGDGLGQTLILHNESARPLELLQVTVEESDEPTPPGHRRWAAADWIRPAKLAAIQRIAPGDTHALDVVIRAPTTVPQLEASDPPGWLDGHVTLHCRHQDEELFLRSRLRGSVIRAPQLEASTRELTLPASRSNERRHEFVVRNTGHLPLRLGDAYLLGQHEGTWQPAPEVDWLRVRGVERGQLVPAGGRCVLEISVHPEARARHRASETWGQRRLILEHDGWQPAQLDPSARETPGWTLDIHVEFGRVVDRFAAGVDFGTSSSVVCILGDERAYPLILELEQRRPSLASLMYFRADQPEAVEDTPAGPRDAPPAPAPTPQSRFLFGQQAHHSAGIDPANLVRSIKTVIALDPQTTYNFLYRSGDEVHRARYSAQQLLDIFIGELLSRAERGVTLLGPAARNDLRLSGGRVVFQKAVFSHPVEVTEAMRGALMSAAHSVGVNLDQTTVDGFFAERCVDEASAAVLAYVDARERGDVAEGEPFAPIERVLCFDMGGGTTDLAAVEVHDLDRYVSTDPNDVAEDVHVTVELKSNAGMRLGGDDLDLLLAEWLLGRLREEETNPSLLHWLDEIHRALHARLFNEYQSGLRQRASLHEAWADLTPDRFEDLATDIYGRATGLLQAAEAAKKSLSEQPHTELTLPLSSSLPTSAEDESISVRDFTATIERETFEDLVRERVQDVMPLLDSVVERAGWQWSDLTTLLFTGQGVRVPVIRRQVRETVAERRKNGDDALILIEPSASGQEGLDAAFDPKHCVAIGAALWQRSREEGAWLRLRNTLHERLSFDLQRKAGRRRFRTVKGLERDTDLPVEIPLHEPVKIDRLELYRDRQPYMRFQFEPTTDLVLKVHGPADMWVIVDGEESKGVPLQ